MLIKVNSNSDTLEYALNDYSKKTQTIYVVTIITVAAAIISLPFIHVDISIQGTGILRPVAEKTEVRAAVSELIDSVFVKEGDFVDKGEIILTQRCHSVDSRITMLRYQIIQTENMIHDLENLISKNDFKNFRSSRYAQEYSYYLQQKVELQNKLDKSQKELKRNEKLYNSEVIAEKEFDEYRFQYLTTNNELKIFVDNQKTKWQSELLQLRLQRNDLQSQLIQAEKEKELFTVRAPVSGTLEQFAGLYNGNMLSAGEVVAVISPDSSLVAEIYLRTQDIGYITNNTKVNIQVDAFNYNEWGIIKGQIVHIASDFIMINNVPMFRVKCQLDRNYLALKSGIKGILKKGMTVRARFIITNRSLLQLLYQKTDKWLNPTQY